MYISTVAFGLQINLYKIVFDRFYRNLNYYRYMNITEEINKSLLGIVKRAEKQSIEQLVATFVDIGPLFKILSNIDHQILYGRRGTGKTHAFK